MNKEVLQGLINLYLATRNMPLRDISPQLNVAYHQAAKTLLELKSTGIITVHSSTGNITIN